MGPGSGPWITGAPESHGLSSSALTAAAKRVASDVPFRYCFLVAAGGELVHESYEANFSSTLYESDSMGKTTTALLVGRAVTLGLVDIDKPLSEYGVVPAADWGKWWPQITARIVLSQTTGMGHVEPGKHFTYDSDQYIQHLALLLDAVMPAGTTTQQWATANFAIPLGIPDIYRYEGLNGTISAGGGQMVTCRQLLRLGQLIANRGAWVDAAGAETQFIDRAYMTQMTEPSYPKAFISYGFLTWLNRRRGAGDPQCCAPRWGDRDRCSNKLTQSIIGDDNEDVGAPSAMAIAFGWLSRAYFVVPGTNLVVVSIGSSWGWARSCRQYDDGYTQTLIWNAIRPAVAPLWNSSTTAAPPTAAAPRLPTHPSAPPAPSARRLGDGAPVAARDDGAGTITGQCRCACPPTQGFGTCFNLEAGSADAENGYCAGVVDRAAETCPRVAIVAQCNATMRNWTAAQICAVAVADTLSSETGWLGLTKTNCVPMGSADETPCRPTGSAGDATFDSAFCDCTPAEFAWCEHTATASACEYDPYFGPAA